MAKEYKDLIVGLDIGTSKIMAVVAEVQADASIKVLGMGVAPSTGMKRGVVVNIEASVQSIQQAVRGNLRASNGDALLAAALGGQGLIYEPSFIVGDAVAQGLLQVLPLDHPPRELGGIHAVWPASRHVPAKVRAMVDFLVEGLGDARQPPSTTPAHG